MVKTYEQLRPELANEAIWAQRQHVDIAVTADRPPDGELDRMPADDPPRAGHRREDLSGFRGRGLQAAVQPSLGFAQLLVGSGQDTAADQQVPQVDETGAGDW